MRGQGQTDELFTYRGDAGTNIDCRVAGIFDPRAPHRACHSIRRQWLKMYGNVIKSYLITVKVNKSCFIPFFAINLRILTLFNDDDHALLFYSYIKSAPQRHGAGRGLIVGRASPK